MAAFEVGTLEVGDRDVDAECVEAPRSERNQRVMRGARGETGGDAGAEFTARAASMNLAARSKCGERSKFGESSAAISM